MNFFSELLKKNFKTIFTNRCSRKRNIFIQDGDLPKKNKAAVTQLKTIKATQLNIPARSPGINPMEKLFNLIEEKPRHVAVSQKITKENFGQFSNRLKSVLLTFPVSPIDNIIRSMPKRMKEVIQKKKRENQILDIIFLSY